ncbi:Tetratricopeptide repeat protein [Geobacillus sp. BCO2]|nr:Tetratricopeptide repeat protein [Geobacillus sp. BCO2]
MAEEPLAREALLLLGEQYMETGRYQEAAALWERYADWYPEDEELNMQLAAAYEAAGHIERALAAIERCAHMANDARLRYERARYLVLLGRFNEARQELRAALAADESGELALLAADEPAFHRLEQM